MPSEDTLLGLAIGLLIAVVVYTAMKYRIKSRIAQIEAEFRRMWAEQESGIRRDAADRSRYVIKGRLAEHMVPLLSDVFRHDPSDARFIGSPIDYLIFEGLTAAKDGQSGGPVTVVLADIKTGEAVLSSSERKIKDAVDAGRVKWETIRVDF
jgi:predicted Holliday junction resolvase-like endonuclease